MTLVWDLPLPYLLASRLACLLPARGVTCADPMIVLQDNN